MCSYLAAPGGQAGPVALVPGGRSLVPGGQAGPVAALPGGGQAGRVAWFVITSSRLVHLVFVSGGLVRWSRRLVNVLGVRRLVRGPWSAPWWPGRVPAGVLAIVSAR